MNKIYGWLTNIKTLTLIAVVSLVVACTALVYINVVDSRREQDAVDTDEAVCQAVVINHEYLLELLDAFSNQTEDPEATRALFEQLLAPLEEEFQNNLLLIKRLNDGSECG